MIFMECDCKFFCRSHNLNSHIGCACSQISEGVESATVEANVVEGENTYSVNETITTSEQTVSIKYGVDFTVSYVLVGEDETDGSMPNLQRCNLCEWTHFLQEQNSYCCKLLFVYLFFLCKLGQLQNDVALKVNTFVYTGFTFGGWYYYDEQNRQVFIKDNKWFYLEAGKEVGCACSQI